MSLPDDNEEILPQDQRKDQEETVDPDTERALFLRAFAEDTTKSYKYYAREFNITEEEAYDYVKKVSYGL